MVTHARRRGGPFGAAPAGGGGDPWVVVALRCCAWLAALVFAHQYLMMLTMAASSSLPSSFNAPATHGTAFPGAAPSTRLRDLASWLQPRPLNVLPRASADSAAPLGGSHPPVTRGSVTATRFGSDDREPLGIAATGGGGRSGGGWRSRERRLIQQGSVASIDRHPYVAVVTRPDGSYLCAGSLIHPRVVITAGHCVSPSVGGTVNPTVYLGLERLQPTAGGGGGGAGGGGGRLVAAAAAAGGAVLVNALAALVGLGSTGGRASGGRAMSTRSVAHPKYNPGIFDFDVALLLLNKDAAPPAKTVRLPPAGDALPRSPRLMALGWGATEDNSLSQDLRRGAVTPLNRDTCEELFQPYGTDITQRMLCTTGRTCAGDSGGPLILEGGGLRDTDGEDDAGYGDGGDGGDDGDMLVGHVSFGFPRRKGQGCPQPNPATVFTDLRNPEINAWVRSQLALVHQQMADDDARPADLEADTDADREVKEDAAGSGDGGGDGGGGQDSVKKGR